MRWVESKFAIRNGVFSMRPGGGGWLGGAGIGRGRGAVGAHASLGESAVWEASQGLGLCELDDVVGPVQLGTEAGRGDDGGGGDSDGVGVFEEIFEGGAKASLAAG